MEIEFEYQDAHSNGKWSHQVAVCPSVQDMVKFYGLDQPDVKWRIVSIKK